MAQRSRSNFKATKNTRFADNATGDISEGDSRDMYEDVADSFVNWTDDVIDEDDMASDSDTAVPTQQSVKAFVVANSAAPVMQYAKVTLSSSDLQNLHTTPKELIAAPGANKFIVVEKIYYHLKAGSSGYGSSNLQVELSGGQDIAAAINVNAVGDVISPRTPSGYSSVLGTLVNEAIQISAAGDLGAGDGTLTMHLWYYIADLT